MSFAPRARVVNPWLGTYFGIFASALAAIFLLSLIFERLGVPGESLRWLLLLGPIGLYLGVGIAARTREPIEYLAAGRRVPAAYTGLILAVTALGATGLLAVTGAFFLTGFDALIFSMGGLTGFVAMAVLLAPYLRKFGALTIPSYLGRRFDSRVVRIFAAALLAVPMLLLLAAELRIGAFAASLLSGAPESLMIGLLLLAMLLALVPGGARANTWSGVAQSIAMLLALMVPVALYAALATNLPLPQLTSGPVLRSLLRTEIAQGLPILAPSPLHLELPGIGLLPIAKPFAVPFGTVGPFAFVLATLSIAAGVAAAPWLLVRLASTTSVYEARKSLGWATFFFGVVMLTLASVAVFMRDFIMDLVIAGRPGVLPDWMKELVRLGFAQVETSSTRLAMTSFSFDRDGVLFSLPVAAGFPAVFLYFSIAGIVAAALAAAGAAVVALGNMLAEDVINGLSAEPAPDRLRLSIARVSLGVAIALGGLIAVLAPTDPLRLILWSLALTGSALFPVLVLSIWWKRANAFGALAGLFSGFTVGVLTIFACETHWLELDSALACALGVPAGALAVIAASAATPSPSRRVLELVDDLRVPGGEILSDRELRQSRLKNRDLY